MKLARTFRYNGLALLNVLLQLINSVLNLNVFGVGIESDALFVSNLIVASLSFISLFWMEQFWVFYSEIRCASKEKAVRFYRTVLTLSMLAQALFVAACLGGLDGLFALFTGAMEPDRLAVLRPVLMIQLVGFLLFPMGQINAVILNAEGRIGAGYALQLLPQGFSAIAFCYFLLWGGRDPRTYALVGVIGGGAMVLTQFLLMSKQGVTYRPSFKHGRYAAFLKGSLLLRLGQNINNFLQQPIITGTLTGFAEGAASVYTYARRFAEILYSLTIGPEFLVLRQLVNDRYPTGKALAIRAGFRKFYKGMLLIVPLGLIAWVCLVPAISFVTGGRIEGRVLVEIRNVFTLFLGWILLLAIEQPFVVLLLAAKRNSLFVVENILYVGILFASISVLAPLLGILSLPLALIAAQASNVGINTFFGSRLLSSLKESALEAAI